MRPTSTWWLKSRDSRPSSPVCPSTVCERSAPGGRCPDEGLLGAGVAQALGLRLGDRLTIRYGEATHRPVIVGLLETGGSEENQAFVPLSVAQTLTGRAGQVGLVQVSALTTGRPLEQITAEIEARLPAVQSRTLRQFAQAEEAVLSRIRLLMALVAALVLAVAALAVGSTMVTLYQMEYTCRSTLECLSKFR